MEVKFSPELEAKLDSIASQQGRARETLVREAVEQFVQHTEWFHKEVDAGLAEVRRGDTLEHDRVAARMEELIAQKKRHT
jgi:predicted transcriptional regulator